MLKSLVFFGIWLILLWPIFIISTDPETSFSDINESKNEPAPVVSEREGSRSNLPGHGSSGFGHEQATNKISGNEIERKEEVASYVPPKSEEKTGSSENKTEENALPASTKSELVSNNVSTSEDVFVMLDKDAAGAEPNMTADNIDDGAKDMLTLDSMPTEETSSQDEDENRTMAEGIPSFSEWTALQLSKKQGTASNLPQTNGGGSPREVKKEDGKNFASPDCGAKVLLANPEAQNPGGPLSSSHDEYMLNRCGVTSWIILELCESIKVEKVSIGNLELFSSSPKEIEVGVSDRYPTREWAKIGPLELPDARAIHSLTVSSNSSYSKFLKVQVLSHHGSEHYCPISAIRIYGKSEYEVLEGESSHSDEERITENEQSPLSEDMGTGGISEKSVIGSAADAMINIVMKAAQVLKRGGSDDSKTGDNCQSTTECFSTNNFTVNATEVCNQRILYFVQHHSRYLSNNSDCEKALRTSSYGGPSSIEGFWRAIFGDGIWHLVCDYMSPIRNCSAGLLNTTLPVEVPKVEATTSSKSNGTANQNAVPETVVPPGNGKGEPVVEIVPPVEKPLPVVVEEESRVQKESVFVRLTNRIKILEANQSLSSGYLEELSQRFKKQSEESYTVSQGLKRAFNDSVSKFKWIEDFSRREATYLRRSIVDLRATLWRTEMQRLFLIFVSLLQFFGITLFCCWTRRRICNLEDQFNTFLNNSTMKVPTITVEARKESLPCVLPRKRSNSHPDIMKPKKKKKKKDVIKNLENQFKYDIGGSSSVLADPIGGFPKPYQHPMTLPLVPTNLNTQATATIKPFASMDGANSTNRFHVLASPSSHSVSSFERLSGSTSSVDGALLGRIPGSIPNGSGSLSGESQDSESAKLKSKKNKFKKFIPKFFE